MEETLFKAKNYINAILCQCNSWNDRGRGICYTRDSLFLCLEAGTGKRLIDSLYSGYPIGYIIT